MLRRQHLILHLVVGCACAVVMTAGCTPKKKSETRVQLPTRYATLPVKQVPAVGEYFHPVGDWDWWRSKLEELSRE